MAATSPAGAGSKRSFPGAGDSATRSARQAERRRTTATRRRIGGHECPGRGRARLHRLVNPHFPSLEQFRDAASKGNLIPVYREILADGDTPVSAYAKLGRRDYSFLLESVLGGQKWAAYSFLGVAPR